MNRIRNRKPAFERQNFPRTVRFSQQAFEAEVGDLAQSPMVETGIFANTVSVRMAQKRSDFADRMAPFHQSIRASVTQRVGTMAQRGDPILASVNLIWPLLIFSFGPTLW